MHRRSESAAEGCLLCGSCLQSRRMSCSRCVPDGFTVRGRLFPAERCSACPRPLVSGGEMFCLSAAACFRRKDVLLVRCRGKAERYRPGRRLADAGSPLRSSARHIRSSRKIRYSSTPPFSRRIRRRLSARVLGRSHMTFSMHRFLISHFSFSTRADRSTRSFLSVSSDRR